MSYLPFFEQVRKEIGGRFVVGAGAYGQPDDHPVPFLEAAFDDLGFAVVGYAHRHPYGLGSIFPGHIDLCRTPPPDAFVALLHL